MTEHVSYGFAVFDGGRRTDFDVIANTKDEKKVTALARKKNLIMAECYCILYRDISMPMLISATEAVLK